MDYKKYLFAVLALIPLTDAIHVNMQGTLGFGSDVMKSISNYMRRQFEISDIGRRTLSLNKGESDLSFLIIQSTYLCREISFCDGFLETFVNEYILVQTKAIESTLKRILYPKGVNNEKTKNYLIFDEELKKCLQEIRSMLKNLDSKTVDNVDPYTWNEILKKISVMLHTEAIKFATERIEGTKSDLVEAKKRLTQKFVISSVIVERKYEYKLCTDFDICTKTFKCTKALQTLLEKFKDMSDDNVKIFIRYVAEALSNTKFYAILSETTANEMQIILNDMAYSDSVPTKEVLLSIHRTVEDKLTSQTMKKYTEKGRDVELVDAILSDMDHAYSKSSVDPFYAFMSSFYEWLRSGARLGPSIRALIIDITNQLNELSDDLVWKVTNEVRVFLEITVDPEK